MKRLLFMKDNLSKFQQKIGYQFKDESLLKQALTHRSIGKMNNERLEFVGDAFLSGIIADVLYQCYPNEDEGYLSRFRSYLVKGDRLAEIATSYQLGQYLKLGAGELKSGGRSRVSILAGALEAVFAAIYYDGGFFALQSVIHNIYLPLIKEGMLLDDLHDFKTKLQERLQAVPLPLPEYHLERIEGSEHNQKFYVRCHVKSTLETFLGIGSSRRRAEQAAAREALARLFISN
jgi:ribonuclease-3